MFFRGLLSRTDHNYRKAELLKRKSEGEKKDNKERKKLGI